MPRPLLQVGPPWQVAPRQHQEDFEELLRSLSSTCERLKQHYYDLVRENSDLRADLNGDRADLPPACKGAAKAGKAALKASVLDCSESTPRSPEACEDNPILEERQPVMPERHSVWPAFEERHSAWRASVPPKQATSFRIAGSESAKVRATGSESAKTSLGRGRPREDLFHRLDIHDEGRLYIKDLIRIMRGAGKPVEYGSLVNLVRAFNSLEPFDLDSTGNLEDSDVQVELLMREDTSIDRPAFMRLMDDALRYDHFGSAYESCLRSLREACYQDASRPTIITVDLASNMGGRPQQEQNKLRAFWLEVVPAAVIILNMLVAGLSAEFPESDEVWDIFEYSFAGWYTLEFLAKLKMDGCREYFMGAERWWNLFDLGCLTLSFADPAAKIWITIFMEEGNRPDLSALITVKMLRLARLARLVRILRFKIFEDLKLMIFGIFAGLRVLTWAIVLLVLLVYLFGVALTNIFGKQELEFESVVASMFTLFRCWTEGCAAYDGTPLSERLRVRYGFGFVVFHILMTMVVTVGLFNLIMAIFIDNVVSTQSFRKRKEMVERSYEIETRFKLLFISLINGCKGKKAPQLNYKKLKKSISAVNVEWDALSKGNVIVTREAFQRWLEDKDFQNLLEEAEIDTANHVELFDVLDADRGGTLSMEELTTGLMKLRGPVTKADIVAMRLNVRLLTSHVGAAMAEESAPLGIRKTVIS